MIELSISMAVGAVVLFMVFKFMTYTRMHFMHGTVNLQNLSEIKSAINYLRRDFSSACPYLSQNDSRLKLPELRNLPFNVNNKADGLDSKLVVLDAANKKLQFHRFVFDTESGAAFAPKVQEVIYVYNSQKKTLTRTMGTTKVVFNGFENVEFKYFLSEYNERVPILWVKIVAHEGKNAVGANMDLGKPVELTASIASSFMVSYYTNKSWNLDTVHSK